MTTMILGSILTVGVDSQSSEHYKLTYLFPLRSPWKVAGSVPTLLLARFEYSSPNFWSDHDVGDVSVGNCKPEGALWSVSELNRPVGFG